MSWRLSKAEQSVRGSPNCGGGFLWVPASPSELAPKFPFEKCSYIGLGGFRGLGGSLLKSSEKASNIPGAYPALAF